MPLFVVAVGAVTVTVTAVMVYMAVVAPSAPAEWTEVGEQNPAHQPFRVPLANPSRAGEDWHAGSIARAS